MFLFLRIQFFYFKMLLFRIFYFILLLSASILLNIQKFFVCSGGQTQSLYYGPP